MEYGVIYKGEEEYPETLLKLKDPPKKLYVMGEKKVLKEFSLAVVGARNVSDYGKETAKRICNGISKQKIPIVSGFAYGVDTIAHTAAIQNHEKTIAVLAGGFQHIYPKENEPLITQIVEAGGAIICEHDVDVSPLKKLFAGRNRIIAALSQGVVIIEAGKKSGSLITAKNAITLEKKIFVVPGGIYDSHYQGSNQLLVDGAKCVVDYPDILRAYEETLHIEKIVEEVKYIPKEYASIYACLESPQTAQQVARKLSMEISKVNASLTVMEIEGWIKGISNNSFIQLR